VEIWNLPAYINVLRLSHYEQNKNKAKKTKTYYPSQKEKHVGWVMPWAAILDL